MNPAVGLLARTQFRRRALALVLLGVLAGLVGAVVVGTLVLARRTGTSFERLLERSGTGDVIVNTMVEPFALGDQVLDLPGVEKGWSATVSVARPDVEEETYVAVLSGPEAPEGVYDLPLVEGRRADPDNPSEVVLVERLADAFGLEPGSVVPVTFLLPEQHTQWDTGFGEPAGPAMDLEVVGIVRTPLQLESMPPLLATPAFHEQVASTTGVGRSTIIELDGGETAIAAFEDELAEFRARTHRPEGFETFPQVTTTFPARTGGTVDSTSSVMVTGLLVLAGIAAVAGFLALAQAFGRHHDRDLESQAIERALGLGRGARTLSRTIPALASAATATALTLAGALLGGRFEPMGGLAVYEPAPGWSPNLALTAVGSVAMGGLVLLVAAGTARLSERRAALRARGERRSRVTERGARAGRPPTAVGVRFALDPGRGRSAVPVRSAILAVALAIGGVAAAAVFTSSLDRLGGAPERWGGRAEFDLADADESEIEAVLDDERLSQVSRSEVSEAVDVADEEEPVWSVDPLRGDLSWTIVEGRLPTGEDEVVLGTRVTRATGLEIGDQAPVGAGDDRRSLTVVGIGIGPTSAGEALGAGVLVSPQTRERLGLDNATVGLLVGVGPDHDADAVTSEYAARYEITPRERPTDVEDLVSVGRVPQAVALVIAVLGLAALANGLVLAVRRRRRDLAVLRTLGFTPGEASSSIVSMAVVWSGLGAIVGVPLGIAAGRLLWRGVADGVGVASDPLTPALVLTLAPAVLAIAVALSIVPARRAGRLRPVTLLHEE